MVSRGVLDAVLLDVGNTLLYLDYPRLVRTLAPFLPEDVTPERAARAERRARPRLSRWLHETRSSTEDPGSFARYLAFAFEELALEAPPAVAFEALCAEHRRENFFSVPPLGIEEALSALAKRFKVAVVSNAGGQAREKLVRAGLARDLLTVLDSAIEGVEKPDPRIFLACCERIDVAPGRALYVGDLHAIDVVGARAAGIAPVLLDPEGAYAELGVADARLVADVPSLARELLSAFPGS
ncbi:MAG TPA: HAD family hydrolase [Planctomycetota bacterium]|nr:HAD family hydrolase [Planctomycetota bacterium]